VARFLAKLAKLIVRPEYAMQVNMLEAKTQLSKLVEAALRGEEVVIANRGKPVVKLVKAEATAARRWGAWEGLMTDAQIERAFSPEVEAEMAREWIASLQRPLDAGLKARRSTPAMKKAPTANPGGVRRK
jgi:prevent-host-death family protein